jgi:aryl-alcohol dehydrogenase-like predicted oxidoreductase
VTAATTTSPAVLATRRLGRTDMTITRVGFGAWAIGGPDWLFSWGAQDDAASIRAIRHAVERGVNWIDTAPIYGLGHSEDIVGRALAEMSADDRPYVFTKCGQVWDPQDRHTKFRVGKAESLRQEVEDSLKRLRVDVIDLYQMHRPAQDGTEIEDYWQTLVELKAEGKVRAIGLSNHDADQLRRAEAIGHVDSFQPGLSAIQREALEEDVPWCAAHDTGVIVYSPMQSGLLSGGFTQERVASLPADDWRSRDPNFTGEALRRNLAVAEAMKPIAAKHGVSPAAVAIAWTLAMPGVTGAIVGARSPQQVDGWLAAASLALDVDDMAAIAGAIRTNEAGQGPIPA